VIIFFLKRYSISVAGREVCLEGHSDLTDVVFTSTLRHMTPSERSRPSQWHNDFCRNVAWQAFL